MTFPKIAGYNLQNALAALEQIPSAYLTLEQEAAIKTLKEFLDIPELDTDVTEYDEWQSYDPDC